MKIPSQTFDLFEILTNLLQFIYSWFKEGNNEKQNDMLSQQEKLDYDFTIGQVAKVVYFIIQLIYYLDFIKVNPLQYMILISGYYIFVIFLVLVEQKYIFEGYSFTFHRLIAYRIMNIGFNCVSLVLTHFMDQSLLKTWENVKSLNIGIADFVTSTLAFLTILEILSLLFQLSTTVFPCMKQCDNTLDYESKGGTVYLFLGQFIGIVAMGGLFILIFHLNNISIKELFHIIINSGIVYFYGAVILELLLCFYFSCCAYREKQNPPTSKKVFCFGYGFFIGSMSIMSGPAIILVLIYYAQARLLCCCRKCKWKCLICCWCADNDRSRHYHQQSLQQQSLPVQTNEQ